MPRRHQFTFAAVMLFLVLIVSSEFSPGVSYAQELQDEMPELASLQGMRVYFTEDNGEPSRFDRSGNGLSRFAGLLSQFGVSMDTLVWESGIPADADMVVIAAPQQGLSPDQVARLWLYINDGGRVLMLTQPFTFGRGGLVDGFSPSLDGFFVLAWPDYGIRPSNTLVVTEGGTQIVEVPVEVDEDETDPDATVTPAVEEVEIELPALISTFQTTNFNPEHPSVGSLDDEVAFFAAREVEIDASLGDFIVTPLVFSPTNYYGEVRYADFVAEGTADLNIGEDTARGPLIVAAAFEDTGSDSRLILIGDYLVATNGGGFQSSPSYSASLIYPGNARFLMQLVTWLTDAETPTLEFPTPAPTGTATPVPTPIPTNTPEPEAETTGDGN